MADNPRTRNAARSVSEMPKLALLLALASCAATSPDPLYPRTLPEEKRYEFLKAEGTETSPSIRNAFIDGQVIRGMPREWVLELYGRPDAFLDSGWEYRDNKGNPVLGVFFEQDRVDSIVTPVRAGHRDAAR